MPVSFEFVLLCGLCGASLFGLYGTLDDIYFYSRLPLFPFHAKVRTFSGLTLFTVVFCVSLYFLISKYLGG